MVNLKKSRSQSDDIKLSLLDQIQNQITDGFDIGALIFFILKILLILSPSVFLKIHSVQNINVHNASVLQIQKEVDNKKSDLKKVKDKMKGFDYVKNDAKEFNQKKHLLKELAQSRLHHVKVLDSIQTSLGIVLGDNRVPTKFVILESIRFQGSKIFIRGSTNDEQQVHDLMKLFKEGSLYETIQLMNISSTKNSMKQFRIEGKILENI